MSKEEHGNEYWVVQTLTLTRALTGLASAMAILNHYYALTAGVFAVGFATDLADGYLARRFDVTSSEGTTRDILADSCLWASVPFYVLQTVGETADPLRYFYAALLPIYGALSIAYAFARGIDNPHLDVRE